MKFNRIAGLIVIIIALIGYFTVADDLRHTGELAGVTGILLAGMILMAGSFTHRPLLIYSVRWIASGTVPGMILGALIDNMMIGIGAGLAAGSASAWLMRIIHRSKKTENS